MISRLLAFAAILVLLPMSSLAQTPPVDPGAPLSGYPRKALGAPTPSELKTATYVRDVIYSHRDGMALTYDVFKPKQANGALVVNMVSAGWKSSWGPPEERQARYQWLIDKGFTVVALYHSSAPRFQVPDAVADIRLGLRHIKLHAAEYGADPGRIGVWGASAGGHLALVAGLMADDGDPAAANPLERSGNRVKAVVAYFPPTDLDACWEAAQNLAPLISMTSCARRSRPFTSWTHWIRRRLSYLAGQTGAFRYRNRKACMPRSTRQASRTS